MKVKILKIINNITYFKEANSGNLCKKQFLVKI